MSRDSAGKLVPRIRDEFRVVKASSAEHPQLASLYRLWQEVQSRKGPSQEVRLEFSGTEKVTLPASVQEVLGNVVTMLAEGKGVRVVPEDQPLTTGQAAEILNVSRQYLTRLLDEGRIPSFWVGTHRRTALEDVLAFKRERDAQRQRGMRRLVALSEEAGGYDREGE